MAVEISRDECRNYLLQSNLQPNPEHITSISLRQLFDSWWKAFKIRYIEGAADSSKIVQIVQERLNNNPHSLTALDLSWFSAKEIGQLQLKKETILEILLHVGIDDAQKTTRYPAPFLAKQVVLARLAIQADRNLVILLVMILPDEVEQEPLPKEIKITKKRAKRANEIARSLPTPRARQANSSQHSAVLTPGKLVAREFKHCLEVAPPNIPAFNNVQALAKNLDHAPNDPAEKVLEKLSLMAQLFLYEVSSQHQDLLCKLMVASYNAMESDGDQTAEERQEVFRAYLVKNQRDKNVNGRYVTLLEKLPESIKIP